MANCTHYKSNSFYNNFRHYNIDLKNWPHAEEDCGDTRVWRTGNLRWGVAHSIQDILDSGDLGRFWDKRYSLVRRPKLKSTDVGTVNDVPILDEPVTSTRCPGSN